jgi:carotenoid cleavage dioxygenase-like enzyme
MPATALASDRLPPQLRSSILEGPFEGRAEVGGDIPAWLRGRLIRTAPAIFDAGEWHAQHWFDGLGMLYSFEFGPRGTVHWKQRLLDCEYNRSVLRGHTELASFATRDQRGFVRRLVNPFPRSTDNTNVNVIPAGDRWVAMTETERQLRIDPQTLETSGEIHRDDSLPARMLMGAHPHWDPGLGEFVNLGIIYGRETRVVVFSQAGDSGARREIGRVLLRRVPYMHSFSMTPGKIILVMGPYELDPLGLLWSQRPIAEHYRWNPGGGTRILVIDRATGAIEEHRGEAFFCFHTVHAWELAGGVVCLDLLAYPDPHLMRSGMRMDAIRQHGLPTLPPALRRLTITPQRAEFRIEPVAAAPGFEFPAIHSARVHGRPYRIVWGTDLKRLVRVDLERAEAAERSLDDSTFGEPVFVARPGARDEDDGVLLTVGTGSSPDERSELTIWDARDLDVLARVTAPICIPLGFHGGFEMTADGRG